MKHEELLQIVTESYSGIPDHDGNWKANKALRAVVELHKPSVIPDWVPTEKEFICWCAHMYPCPTIQAIEKELS